MQCGLSKKQFHLMHKNQKKLLPLLENASKQANTIDTRALSAKFKSLNISDIPSAETKL